MNKNSTTARLPVEVQHSNLTDPLRVESQMTGTVVKNDPKVPTKILRAVSLRLIRPQRTFSRDLYALKLQIQVESLRKV